MIFLGARGPAPKDPKKRQRRNAGGQVLEIDDAKLARAPELGPGMLAKTRDSWREFWHSKLAQRIVLATDLPALRRLFSLYDERERAYRGYVKRRLVTGSQGQQVINPLAKVMQSCDAEIRALEDRFGLTPVSRLRLGIALGEAKKTLEAMNDELNEDDDEAEEEEDPRVVTKQLKS